MKKIISLCWILWSFLSFADVTYEFKSNLTFNKDVTIVDGEMESYSLKGNEKVKLLITFLEKKSFKSEIENSSANDLKNKFVDKNESLDFLNQYSNRKVLSYNKEIINDLVVFKIQYELLDKEVPSIEENVYIVSSNSTAIASLIFPKDTKAEIRQELEENLKNFNIVNAKSELTVFQKVKNKFNELVNFKYVAKVFINNAYAAELATKYQACNAKDYLGKGGYTTKPGSALFNISKIAEDLKQETINQTLKKEKKSKTSDERINCLSNLYKDAKEGASSYWANRLDDEGCIDGDNVAESGNANCKDSILKEYKKSKSYIDKVDADLNDFVSGKVSIERSSCRIPDNAQKELDDFKKLGADANSAFCCAEGGEGNFYDKGPLYKVLEDEENFKKLDSNQKTIQCLQKTKEDPNKTFLSANGLTDCMQNMYEGLVKVIKDALKTVASLFDLETYKALGKFISNMPDSGKALLQTLGEHIGTEIYSVTNCMSSYEAKQYTCKMIPNVASILLGPGLIKSFAKAVVDKASKTALAELVSKAMSENKALQKVKAASAAAASSARRVVAPVLESRMVKPAADVLQKIAKTLGKDISTPIKDKIVAKAKGLKQNGLRLQVSNEGSILRREAVSTMSSDMNQFQALKNGEKTAEALEKAEELKAQMLRNATNLSNEERLKLAELFTREGAPLTEAQKKLILEAHEVGIAEGRGFGTYTADDIAKKTRLLKEAGITDPNERRLLMESGITGTQSKIAPQLSVSHKERVAAEKIMNSFSTTGNKEALKEGLKQSKPFYDQFLKDGKLAEQYFTPDQKGFVNLVMANERGLTAKETAKLFSQTFKGTAQEVQANLKNGIGSMNNLIREYEGMLKNGAKGVPESVKYKIYRARELRGELMESYYTNKYKDKFNDIDFDKMHDREMELYKKYKAEVEQSKAEMQKLKLPVEGD